MYETFFGLKTKPFSLTSDPSFLYLTSQHREVLAGLAYAILAKKGFVVLTGEAGTGKTTLLCKVLQQLPSTRLRSSVVLDPTLTADELVELFFLNLDVPNVPTSKAQRISLLHKLLLESRAKDQIVALIIDEAHRLSEEALEQVRLLGNFEAGGEKLLQIALIGQLELNDSLNHPTQRYLKQRIPLRLAMRPLLPNEVPSYIAHRWKIAGGITEPPFADSAVDCIGQTSSGIPRIINAICDNALMTALAHKHKQVELSDVQASLRDLDIGHAIGSSGMHDDSSGFSGTGHPETEKVSAIGRLVRKFTPVNGSGRL